MAWEEVVGAGEEEEEEEAERGGQVMGLVLVA